MMIPGHTLSTGTAATTERHGHTLADFPALHIAADSSDLTGKFMPGNMRQMHIGVMAHPAVPVAAAQTGRLDGDDDAVN